jgi:hypothetical protein
MTARAAAGSVLLTGVTDDGKEAKGGSANAGQRFRKRLTVVALGRWCLFLWCLFRWCLFLGCLFWWCRSCLCAAPDAAPYDLCACPDAVHGDPCADPGDAPSRVSGPQHLMLLALRLAFHAKCCHSQNPKGCTTRPHLRFNFFIHVQSPWLGNYFSGSIGSGMLFLGRETLSSRIMRRYSAPRSLLGGLHDSAYST